jgi:hypothetical protein
MKEKSRPLQTVTPKFRGGQHVRISKEKNCFAKEAEHNYTTEIFRINLYRTYAPAQARHSNVRGTNAPAPKCCNHLNAQYTHVEA